MRCAEPGTVGAVTARFDRDTALHPLGGGAFEGRIDRGWWIERGPNGGYVAAIVLRGLAAAVERPDRSPRSLTVHFLAPPAEGPVRLDTVVERDGRQMTFVSGRLSQEGRLLATAQAAFARPLPGIEFCDLQPPDVLPPDQLPRMASVSGDRHIPMRDRYEMRWGIGAPPFSGAPQAVAGGWLRLVEPRPIDAPLLVAFADAWLPPVFTRSSERMAVPTIDLTVHFRTPLSGLPKDDEGWALVVFRSQMAADGFVEEDGEVWSRNGRLLAHSRQLAVLLPV